MSDPRAQEGWSVVRAAARHAVQRLDDALLSAYAIGSLAHGGFAPAVSDIDLALLTGEPAPDMPDVVADLVAEVSSLNQLGQRLSVFYCPWERFADPPPDARFPPIDRFDLVHYGVLIAGNDMRDNYAIAPTAEAIRAQAVDSALRRITLAQLTRDLEHLEAGGVTVHDATKIVLWPIRLQHVCDVGQATGNADAVQHYLALPDASHPELAQDALAWRDLTEIPDRRGALHRITEQIHQLHAEVFRRLANRASTPRRQEIAARAHQLSQA